MIRQSENIASLSAALSVAQGEIENASKDSVNPHFRSGYASLSETLNVIRPVFAKNGLAVVQIPTVDLSTGALNLTTRLMHASGEYLEGDYPIQPTKNDPQGLGSAVTYARRYCLMAVAGIAPEDDDGNAASEKPTHQPAKEIKPVVQEPRFTAPAGKNQQAATEKADPKKSDEYVPTAKLHELLALVRKLEPELTVDQAKAKMLDSAKKLGKGNLKGITQAEYVKMEDDLRQTRIA